jgi:hypothetical protein
LCDWEGLAREAQFIRPDGQPDPKLLAMVANMRFNLQEAMRQFGIAPTQTFPSDTQLADKHGRRSDYWNYDFSHLFVHGAQSSLVLGHFGLEWLTMESRLSKSI